MTLASACDRHTEVATQDEPDVASSEQTTGREDALAEGSGEPEQTDKESDTHPDTNALEAANDLIYEIPSVEPDLLERPLPPTRVTVADYHQRLSRAALLGKELSETDLAQPVFQRTHALRTAQLVLANRIVDSRLGRDRDQAELLETLEGIRGFSQLAHPQDLDARLSSLGVTPADFWITARDLDSIEKLTSWLLAAIDDESLWEEYAKQNTRFRLEMLRYLNAPTSAEITNFAARNRDRIQRYYRDNPRDFRLPEQAWVRKFVVAVSHDAPEDEARAAKKRAETFRRRALNEDFGGLAEQYSDDVLTAQAGGRMQPVTRRIMPTAFETKVGEVSPVKRSKSGYYFILVERRREQVVRPLNRAVEREIASKLLQEHPIPSVLQQAKIGARLLIAGDSDAIAEHAADTLRITHQESKLVALDPVGGVPGIGFLPQVTARLASMEIGAVSEPVRDGDYLYVTKLHQRETPDRLLFESQLEDFREATLQRKRSTIAWDYLQALLPKRIGLDLAPIQNRYGVVSAKGVLDQRPDTAAEAAAPEGDE